MRCRLRSDTACNGHAHAAVLPGAAARSSGDNSGLATARPHSASILAAHQQPSPFASRPVAPSRPLPLVFRAGEPGRAKPLPGRGQRGYSGTGTGAAASKRGSLGASLTFGPGRCTTRPRPVPWDCCFALRLMVRLRCPFLVQVKWRSVCPSLPPAFVQPLWPSPTTAGALMPGVC